MGSTTFWIMLLLSPNIFDALSIGMPIILSLYCMAQFLSIVILRLTNSKQNELDSTIFWHLEYHLTGALFKKMRMLVVDLCIARQVAYATSQ